MFDLPLHPVAVHFPIVIGVVLPFIALGLLWAIRKDRIQQKVWIGVTVLALAYGASAWVAAELGEEDEDKVEKVVAEEVLEEHEEAGERLPWIAGGLVILSLGGLMTRHARKAQIAFVVLSLVAIVPLAQTGHSGGKLVYQYGAANAHLPEKVRAALPLIQYDEEEHEHAEKEDDDD